MSRVWTIAKREYLGYFKVPMGWILAAIYSAVAGFYYSLMLSTGYVDTSAVLQFIRGLFFVIIPLLTMRTFSNDQRDGTFILYSTSPATSGQIVTGKYLGSLLIFLTISFINIIFIITTILFDGNIDIKFWGTLIAFLLTAFAYIAIGNFTSALTDNQIISATISFVIFIAFELFNSISAMIGSGITSLINNLDFGNNISAAVEQNIGRAVTNGLNWLNPASKLTGFYQGTFDLVSVIYFISLIAIFLYITAQVIESARWKK